MSTPELDEKIAKILSVRIHVMIGDSNVTGEELIALQLRAALDVIAQMIDSDNGVAAIREAVEAE